MYWEIPLLILCCIFFFFYLITALILAVIDDISFCSNPKSMSSYHVFKTAEASSCLFYGFCAASCFLIIRQRFTIAYEPGMLPGHANCFIPFSFIKWGNCQQIQGRKSKLVIVEIDSSGRTENNLLMMLGL